MRTLSRKAARAFGIFILLAGPCGAAWADGTPSHYIVTVEKVELKRIDGLWITVMAPDRRVDLVEEEARVSFFNNGRVPAGDYVNFRITISDTVSVAGQDHANRTKDGGEAVLVGPSKTLSDFFGEITSFKERSPTWTDEPSEAGFVKFKMEFGDGADDVIQIYRKQDLFEPLIVKNGSFISVLFIFDFTGMIRYLPADSIRPRMPVRDAVIAMPPRQVQEVRVTVDAKTLVFQNSDVVMEF